MIDDLNQDNPFAGQPEHQGTFDDDFLTEEEFDQLTSRGVPAGQYKFKIVSYQEIVPNEEKPTGGRRFSLQVVETDVPEPSGGFPLQDLLFRKYLNPDDKKRQSEQIDRRQLAQFLKACGVEISKGSKINISEACNAVVGMHILARVTEREVNGEVYKDVKGFKAV